MNFCEGQAQKISIGESTIYNWENNLSIPAIKYIPKIIKFLGYVPFDTSAKTTGEKIVTYRRLLGLNQKKLAHRLGIDPSTLGKWERNKRQPPESVLKDITALFTSYFSGSLYIKDHWQYWQKISFWIFYFYYWKLLFMGYIYYKRANGYFPGRLIIVV